MKDLRHNMTEPCRLAVVCFVLFLVTGLDAASGPSPASPEEIRALIRSGRYEDAAKASRVHVAETEMTDGPESLSCAGALDLLVESLQRAGHGAQPETLDLARRAVAIKEARLSADDPDLAVSLRNLAFVLKDRSSLKEAQALYERVLEIHRLRYGNDHVEVAGSLVDLATLLTNRAEYLQAQSLYEQALSIQEKLLGPMDLGVATTLNNLAMVLRRSGDYDGARGNYKRAIAIREAVQGPDHVELAYPLNGLALLMDQTGNHREARRLYDRALTIRRKTLGEDHLLVAVSLNNMALLLERTGYYAEARPLYERAVAIYRKAWGEMNGSTASSLNNLGRLLHLMGDRAEARVLYERALEVRREVLGPRHPETAGSLVELARLSAEEGDDAKAGSLYEEARGMWEEKLGMEHPTTARCYTALAALLEKRGERARARSLAQRALEIQGKVLGRDHADVANSMVLLARLDLHDRDLVAAEARGREALAIRRTAFGADHPLVAESLRQMAEIRFAAGDRAGALAQALEAEKIARRHLALTASTLAEREALGYSMARTTGLDLALSLLRPSSPPAETRQVFEAVVEGRALVLDEMAARHRAAAAATPELRQLQDRLAAARSRYANLSVAGPGEQSSERFSSILKEALEEVETAERAVARAGASRRASVDGARAGLDAVAVALPPRSALVAYVLFDRYDDPLDGVKAGQEAAERSAYRALVLGDVSTMPGSVILGSAREIDGLIDRWDRCVAGRSPCGEADLRRAGGALRSRVWDPVVPLMGVVDRVFIVPDGQLNAINLASLPGDDPAYLVETGPLFHYLSAERDLLRESSRKVPSGLLAIGGPDFGEIGPASGPPPPAAIAAALREDARPPGGEASGCPDLASLRFSPLPAALQEAESIAALWREIGPAGSNARVLAGSEATESAFKAQASSFDVLHLATHGFFLESSCGAGSGGGSRSVGGLVPAGVGAASRAGTVRSPLLLSGLALSGANARRSGDREDGILTAEEVLSLDLSGVSCVVLSACDTGRGQIINGEGLLGFRRAFEIAGAGSLIMSLWPADDQSTLEWMRALYEAWGRLRLSVPESVREASLVTLRRRRTLGQDTSPFYWGGFVAFGDWK